MEDSGPYSSGVVGRWESVGVCRCPLRTTGRPGDPYPAAPSTLAIQSALWMASIAAPVPFSHARAFSCCAHACSA